MMVAYNQCVPIPWRPVDFVLAGRKPRWGVIWNDGAQFWSDKAFTLIDLACLGLILPTPATRRALALAVDCLKEQGYDVVDL